MLFLVVLFLAKKTSVFENALTLIQNKQEGLIYNTATIGELAEKDTDGDTIPDWQETLYGLNPSNKETTPGIPDSTVVEKLRPGEGNIAETMGGENQYAENLTETDKFSRELFTTIASLNQSGAIDQSTTEQIASSLSEEVKNYAPKKIFTLADIKIIKNDSPKATENYAQTLVNIFEKNKAPEYTAIEVLEEFVADGKKVDPSALLKLTPITEYLNTNINEMAEMNVPQSLVSTHLDYLNAMERITENLNDIKNYETDPIPALGAINQYGKNALLFVTAGKNLISEMGQGSI